ncbi:Hypothetical predicted protein [Marmota monax]|uniref:Uncharacterized protein n=1 Tax=Marmota monax TaxID=9995 RepID=A0A5E4CL33_MARMO|nr:hypothetical protein GHT09_013392 [Marmota monax]VTJ82574.1 Hypothetical predicted protein [Marmota monax]
MPEYFTDTASLVLIPNTKTKYSLQYISREKVKISRLCPFETHDEDQIFESEGKWRGRWHFRMQQATANEGPTAAFGETKLGEGKGICGLASYHAAQPPGPGDRDPGHPPDAARPGSAAHRLRGPKGGADRVPSALDTNSPFLSSLGTQCSLENLQTPEISETQAAQSHLGLSGRACGARKGRREVGEEEKPATSRKPALPLCFGT